MPPFDGAGAFGLARYRPGRSLLHLLHPAAKALALAGLLAAAIVAPPPSELAALFLLLNVALLSWAPSALPSAYRTLLALAPFLLLLVAIQSVGVPSVRWGARLPLGPVVLFGGELASCVATLLRYADLVLLLGLWAATSRLSDLAYATESLSAPFARLGFPSRAFSLAITIALYFIPLLGEEAERLRKSQAARGLDFRPRGLGLIRAVRAFLPLLVPLMVLALRHAENLARAMEARGYSSGGTHTRLAAHPVRPADVLVPAVSLLLVPLVLLDPFRNVDSLLRSLAL